MSDADHPPRDSDTPSDSLELSDQELDFVVGGAAIVQTFYFDDQGMMRVQRQRAPQTRRDTVAGPRR